MNERNLEGVNGEIWENHHSAIIDLWSQDEIRFGLEVGLHRAWQSLGAWASVPGWYITSTSQGNGQSTKHVPT